MVNFMRRVFSFFLGMIFAFVLTIGALIGGGYWAFTNLTPKDVGVSEETFGGLATMTFEEWTAFVMDITKDPQSLTVKELEKQGFNTNGFLESLGVDVARADKKDLDSFRELAIGSLFGSTGLYEVNMGVLFLFIPKNEETGRYPIFSESARNRLRQYSLGDVFGEASDNTGLSAILRSMKLGSVLSSVYDEKLVNGEFVYESEDMGLELLANVELGLLTDGSGGSGFNFGYEIKEGYLNSLEGKELVEILASFGTTSDEAFAEKLSALSLFSGATLGELFTYSYETNSYVFTYEPLLEYLSLGKFFGVQLCTQDDSCKIHDNVLDCNGELYENGVVTEKLGLEKALLKNLAATSILDVMGGNLDVPEFLNGMYFGMALGYEPATPTDPSFCDKNCNITGEHKHKYYYVDSEGKYVGNLFNEVSNIAFDDVVAGGGIDVNGILSSATIGEILQYTKEGDVWYDKDGNPVPKDDIASEILYKFYDKNITNIDLEMDQLLEGITLGKVMNLTLKEDGYWYDENGDKADVLYQNLAGLELSALMDANSNALIDSLGDVYIGDFMGYKKVGDKWFDSNNAELFGIDGIIADIKLSEFIGSDNSGLNIEAKFENLPIGELLGYTKVDGIWYKDGNPVANETVTDRVFAELYNKTMKDFTDTENPIEIGELMGDIKLGDFLGLEKIDGVWYEGDVKADVLYQNIADILVSDLIGKPDSLTDELGKLFLGDFMEYEKGEDGKWYFNNEIVVGINETIANIKLSDVLTGDIKVEDTIKGTPIGELLGYVKDGGIWYDSENNPIGNETMEDRIFSKLYDKTMEDLTDTENPIKIEDLMEGIYLGEFLGLEKVDGVWYEGDVKADVLYQNIADMPVSDLIGNPDSLTDKLGELYLGDFMGYEKGEDGKWYLDGEVVAGIDGILAGVSLGSVINGNIEIMDKLKTQITIGEIMGYTYNEGDGFWYNGENIVDNTDLKGKIFYGIYGKNISEFDNLEVEDLLGGIYLGEFLSLKEVNGVWYETDAEGNLKTDGDGNFIKASVLYRAIAGIEVAELMSGDASLETELGKLYVGDFMGYYNDNGVWYNNDGVEVSEINSIMAEIKLSSVLDGNNSVMDDVMSKIKNRVTIGEIMGYTYNEDDGFWYNGETKIDNTDITGKVFYQIYGNTANDFSSLEVEDLLVGIKLGEFLSLKEVNGIWYETDTNGDLVEASVLYQTIADIEVAKLMNGTADLEAELGTLYVGDFMGYYNDNGVWYKDSTKAEKLTGIDKLTAEISLGKVLNGEDLDLDIETLTLSEIITIDSDSNKVLQFLGNTQVGELSSKVNEMTLGDVIDTDSNNMLSLLKDTKLDDLGSKINSLYAGEIMGFTRCTGEFGCPVHENSGCAETKNLWYEQQDSVWVLETGVEARVADLTIDQLAHHGITELNFVLGDVLKDNELNSGLFSLAYSGEIKDEYGNTKYEAVDDISQIPVMQLAERVSLGAETATYAKLEGAGLIHLDEEVEGSLDNIFGTTIKEGVEIGVWEGWTINETLNNLIVMQEVMNAYAVTLADDFTHPYNTNVLGQGDVYVKVTKGETTITIHVAESGQANVVENAYSATHTLTNGKLLLI